MKYLRAFSISALVLTFIGTLGAGLFVHFGIYSVSALQQHTGWIYEILEYARVQSITARADEHAPDLAQVDWQQRGLWLYQDHCQQCHGAPGVAPDAFALGMTPAPSPVVKIGLEKSPQYIYWSVSHGVKMSGMPAWKYRLSESDIWAVVALIEKLPTFTAAEYAQLRHQTRSASSFTGGTLSGTEIDDRAERLKAGRIALQQYNCSGCHEIPGVVAATTQIGPTLKAIQEQVFIAGVLPMSAGNLTRWIMSPQEIKPKTLMPDMGVSKQHAEIMAEYLMSGEDKP